MTQRMHWWSAIGLCGVGLLLIGCAQPTFYERHKETAYDAQGQARTDGWFFNQAFVDAIDQDLTACYAKKKP